MGMTQAYCHPREDGDPDKTWIPKQNLRMTLCKARMIFIKPHTGDELSSPSPTKIEDRLRRGTMLLT